MVQHVPLPEQLAVIAREDDHRVLEGGSLRGGPAQEAIEEIVQLRQGRVVRLRDHAELVGRVLAEAERVLELQAESIGANRVPYDPENVRRGVCPDEGKRVQREDVKPSGARVRGSVAWIASAEEMKLMKPIDEPIHGMGSESPGRNESEPRSGLVRKQDPEAEPSAFGRRQHGWSHSDRCDRTLRRGGRDSTVTRTRRATGEAVLVPARNRWSQVGRITGDTGKSAEDETVAAGPVVATKRGNARGAKGPCCT